jgi:small subunit ribosomal protein S17
MNVRSMICMKNKSKDGIGLGLEAPKKKCEDPACPWHGSLPVRGRVFEGMVKSSKLHNTVIVEWGYNKLIPKYNRYERRRSSVPAHNPSCIHAQEGDKVVIAECRPISKTKHFVVVGFSK